MDDGSAARRLGPTGIVAILVVLALVAAAAWWIWLRPTPVAPGVVFVGDSVTYLSLPDIRSRLGQDHPTVVARIGYRSEDILPLVRQAVRHRGGPGHVRQAVILIGYNDVLRGNVRDTAALRSLLHLADGFDCAIWFTLPPVPLKDAQTDTWNREVRQAARGLDHVHVIDTWRQTVMGAKPGELITRTDGVHPNRAGAARLVQVAEQAIGRHC